MASDSEGLRHHQLAGVGNDRLSCVENGFRFGRVTTYGDLCGLPKLYCRKWLPIRKGYDLFPAPFLGLSPVENGFRFGRVTTCSGLEDPCVRGSSKMASDSEGLRLQAVSPDIWTISPSKMASDSEGLRPKPYRRTF